MEVTHSIFRNVWLVDDDEDDHTVFEEALKEVLPTAALTHLYRCDQLLSNLVLEPPDILFLDINMPPDDGKVCLQQIRGRKGLNRMPVVIYSCSPHPLDIMASYGYGATLYLKKPSRVRDLVTVLRDMFLLNWNDLSGITSAQFERGKFIPFSTA
jgi:response regulator RpfG family c-di-GMP phosphodiesterase